MDERQELNELLLGGKKSQNGKKSLLIIIASSAIIVVVAFAMWKFLDSKEEPKQQVEIDSSIMKPLEVESKNNEYDIDFDNFNNNLDQIEQIYDMDFDKNNINLDSILNSIGEKTTIEKPESKPANEPQKPESKPINSPSATITNEVKEAPKPVESKKPESNKEIKPVIKEPANKPSEPKANAPKPIVSETPKAPQAPKVVTAKPTGALLTGFYWQVGSFEKEPNAEFLNEIKKYNYKTQLNKTSSGTTTTRYLIGPYQSRAAAPAKEQIEKIFKENPTPVEVP